MSMFSFPFFPFIITTDFPITNEKRTKIRKNMYEAIKYNKF